MIVENLLDRSVLLLLDDDEHGQVLEADKDVDHQVDTGPSQSHDIDPFLHSEERG